jgi:formate--tetrahydrofolate ligase
MVQTEVEYNTKAEQDLKRIEKLGLAHLPICMAKTQKSFSDNEKLIGRPTNFTVTVRNLKLRQALVLLFLY